jgi:hypothetical protein
MVSASSFNDLGAITAVADQSSPSQPSFAIYFFSSSRVDTNDSPCDFT